MSEKIVHTVADGKYTIIFDKGQLYALRYSEPWRDLVGDGLVLAMLQEIDSLKEQLRSQDSHFTKQTNLYHLT